VDLQSHIDCLFFMAHSVHALYIALFATSAEQKIKRRKSKMQSNRIHANTINDLKSHKTKASKCLKTDTPNERHSLYFIISNNLVWN